MGIIKTLSNVGAASVRLVISESNWLESQAVEQLRKTAELPGMVAVVGMPDLHPGKGYPIGASFISDNLIYPHLVGSDIGCGMGLWGLDVSPRKVKLDRWQKKLVDLDDSAQSQDETLWTSVMQQFQLRKQDGGINERLGSIGGGNHFAELQKVEKIYSAEDAKYLQLGVGYVALLVHSGSRGLGQDILQQHVSHFGAKGLSAVEPEGMRYLSRHDYAVHWAKANRELIAQRVAERLNVGLRPLLDIGHNTVLALDGPSSAAFVGNQNVDDVLNRYWIHRKGACASDDPYVVIPGSRGSLSYLLKPTIEASELQALAGFSLAHGAGRKWKRSDCRGRLRSNLHYSTLETTALGSRVICANRDLLYEEAPQAYKNVDVVIDDLVAAGLAELVASFKPIITYKTRRK